jgi:hypothetical protein
MNKLTYALACMFCIAIIGTSCTKEETTTAEPGTGMITLELEVNNNEANDTLNSVDDDELIPSGTPIQFEMNTKDYQVNPDANFVYEKKTWTSSVDANGMVTITLPAISSPASVAVKYPDLSLTRTWSIGSGSSTDPLRDTTHTRVYERPNDTLTIYDGADVKLYQLSYELK